MKTMSKRIFSLFLAIICIASIVPSSAFAAKVNTKKMTKTPDITFSISTSSASKAEPVTTRETHPILTETVSDIADVVEENKDEHIELLVQTVNPAKITYGDENGWPILTETGEPFHFERYGKIHWNGWRWTYYTSNIEHTYHWRTEEWIPCDDGLYRTTDGLIVVASQHHEKGEIIDTPFGKGIVLDYCGTKGTIDIYTHYLDPEE